MRDRRSNRQSPSVTRMRSDDLPASLRSEIRRAEAAYAPLPDPWTAAENDRQLARLHAPIEPRTRPGDIERFEREKGVLRQELCLRNITMVFRMVPQFAGKGASAEDLIQYGVAGLLVAIDGWRPLSKLSTYAAWWIQKAMQCEVRHNGSLFWAGFQTSPDEGELVDPNGHHDLERLMACLSGLPEPVPTILLERRRGLSIEDLSRSLGMTTQAVLATEHAALRLLRHRLESLP